MCSVRNSTRTLVILNDGFPDLPGSLQENATLVLLSGHDHFLSNTLKFTTDLPIYHRTQDRTDTEESTK
jgi:hypothetical protein